MRRRTVHADPSGVSRPPWRVLVVDDYEPWRRAVRSALATLTHWQIVGEASDGLEAVHQAQALQPDLVLLDIGLPRRNGIAAAQEIIGVAPTSSILFITEQRSWEIAQAALATGARGYIVKSDAGRELVAAMEAVVQGRRFIGARLGGRVPEPAVAPRPGRHNVVFSGDGSIVDHYASFAAAALAAGSALVVLATDEHRGDLERRLHAGGVDVARGARDGWYLGSGTEAVLSAIVLDGWPDEDRFWSATSLMLTAASASHARHPRVALCGEGASQLLAQGRVDAAIRLEQLCGELTRTYNIDLLCGYAAALSGCDHRVSGLEGICAAHSAVLAS